MAKLGNKSFLKTLIDIIYEIKNIIISRWSRVKKIVEWALHIFSSYVGLAKGTKES